MPSTATAHRASAAAKRRRAAKMNAINLLREDHDKVKKLFDRYERSKSRMDEAKKQALAEEICAELKIHTTLEEEIFYPACRQEMEGEDDLLDEAEVEHASAKSLIEQIEALTPGDELYDAKVKVLGEYVKHHIKEEQNELFPEVRKSDIELAELGQRMAERKKELMAEMA